MARKQTQAQKSAGNEIEGNVDKIREILFGGQMRDYDGRFAELENQVTQRIERMSTEFEKRVERLNNYAKREIDKLSERIKTERQDRVADTKSNARDLKDATQQVEGWFGEVEDRLDAETKDLRNTIHEQSDELAALIAETRDHLNAALVSETHDLANSKLAREDLAGVLSEVALRLTKDIKSPKG